MKLINDRNTLATTSMYTDVTGVSMNEDITRHGVNTHTNKLLVSFAINARGSIYTEPRHKIWYALSYYRYTFSISFASTQVPKEELRSIHTTEPRTCQSFRRNAVQLAPLGRPFLIFFIGYSTPPSAAKRRIISRIDTVWGTLNSLNGIAWVNCYLKCKWW